MPRKFVPVNVRLLGIIFVPSVVYACAFGYLFFYVKFMSRLTYVTVLLTFSVSAFFAVGCLFFTIILGIAHLLPESLLPKAETKKTR